ncbi:L-asparaginase [Alteribacillus persepolensis]|uniref:asparaginase n=1 Tax=Alteribacillus persepolensis TaxID=568899 RepID=A0A1G7ZIG7_9BACI|nr:asparaginase [Alteribacillus persepolensis]SDH08542.1 L-asparaginase [Alteribacillus persepolensis]
MKKIVIITTGGTIASKPNIDSGLLVAGEISGEELTAMFDLPSDIDIVVESFLQKPSMHVDFDDYIKLHETVRKYVNDDTVDGIVITHGTDTLEETAYFLDITVAHRKPVVVTGSQRAPEALGSDAYINVRYAVLTACEKDCADIGTVVVFNESIYAARYVKKVHASNVQGFGTSGFGYLGTVDADNVFLYQKPVKQEVLPLGNMLPKVDIVKAYVSADGTHVDASVAAGAKGIVVEGAGRGQIPVEMADSIRRAIKQNIEVVLTTNAEEGNVLSAYDYRGSTYDLERMGAKLAGDLDAKKARIRLAVSLSAKSDA